MGTCCKMWSIRRSGPKQKCTITWSQGDESCLKPRRDLQDDSSLSSLPGCSGGPDVNRRLAYPTLTPSLLPRTASWATCQSQKPSLLTRDSLTSVAHIGERKSEFTPAPAGGGWARRNEGNRMEGAGCRWGRNVVSP